MAWRNLKRYLKCAGTSITVAVLTLTVGCGTASVVDQSDPPPRRVSAHAELIARASKALDADFTAEYAWSEGGAVTVWAASDGTWRVDVPGWAHDGEVDVSVAWTTGGFFQCALEACVKLAGITGRIPAAFDPQVQRPFLEWLPRLLDRHLPFAVSQDGDCFTLTPNTVVVEGPIPSGEWCVDAHGTILSVATADLGELRLTAPPDQPATTVELPGEIVEGEPLGRKAPKPDPTPTATPPASGEPSPDGENDE